MFFRRRDDRSSFNQSGSGPNSLGRRFLNSGDGCYEAVAHADNGLDELRVVGIVAVQVAELTDGGIDAVFGIDEHFARPEPIGDFAASDERAFPRGEQDEQLDEFTLNAQELPLRRSPAVKTEFAELIDKAPQGPLLRGEGMPQCRRQRSDLKGFSGSPKLHLRLHPLFIAWARIALRFVGSRQFRPRRKGT